MKLQLVKNRKWTDTAIRMGFGSRRTNPKTKREEILENGKWVEVKTDGN